MNRHALQAFFMLLWFSLFIAGVAMICSSQKKVDSQRCQLLNITDFQCNHRYYSYTSMIMSMGNKTIFVNMTDNCLTCDACKNIYEIGKYYDCALIDDIYQIVQLVDEIGNSNMLAGGILLLIISIVCTTINFLLVWYDLCIIRDDYQQL